MCGSSAGRAIAGWGSAHWTEYWHSSMIFRFSPLQATAPTCVTTTFNTHPVREPFSWCSRTVITVFSLLQTRLSVVYGCLWLKATSHLDTVYVLRGREQPYAFERWQIHPWNSLNSVGVSLYIVALFFSFFFLYSGGAFLIWVIAFLVWADWGDCSKRYIVAVWLDKVQVPENNLAAVDFYTVC